MRAFGLYQHHKLSEQIIWFALTVTNTVVTKLCGWLFRVIMLTCSVRIFPARLVVYVECAHNVNDVHTVNNAIPVCNAILPDQYIGGTQHVQNKLRCLFNMVEKRL